jgi:hypothetical protein
LKYLFPHALAVRVRKSAFPLGPYFAVLLLVTGVSYPLYGGVQLRVFHMARRIAERHELTLGCHIWDNEDIANAAILSRMYFPTVCGPIYAFHRGHTLPSLQAAARGVPPETALYQSPVLHRLVRAGI